MNLLIFFAIVLSTIILAIVLQRIIHCPILVGFAFFAIYLIVAAVLENMTFVIFAIILGIIAFFSAFIYCVLSSSSWLGNNNCTSLSNNNNSNGTGVTNLDDDELTIVNSNGDVILEPTYKSDELSPVFIGKYCLKNGVVRDSI